jgi:predicted metal-dependent hydrolase
MGTQLQLGEIQVEVVLKEIKNIHLSVYPPAGKVRISAPSRMTLDTIRLFAISKLGWIKQQQAKLQGQERETRREYLDRESHFVWGKRYLLKVIECDKAPSVELHHSRMFLRLRPGTPSNEARAVVEAWYRIQIRKAVPPLIAKWEPVMGVKVKQFFVQKMKTKWGSCNSASKTIRLNTDLAKKPPQCLEYIVVHEMAHLLVRHHDEQFGRIMDECLQGWRLLRQMLNEAPLAHIDWTY